MYDLESNRSRRIIWSVCRVLLLLAIISAVSPAQSEQRIPVAEENWFPLVIDGLRDDTAVFAVRQNTDLILVGTREQGLFLSTDAGASWEQPDLMRDSYVRDLWLSDSGSVALAATFGSDLWRSTDGGSSWDPISELGTPFHYSIAAWQDGVQNTLIVGTANKGVWKSTDLGESWSETGDLDSPGVVALVAAVSGEVIYAGSVDNGVYKTENGGDSWQQTGFEGHTVRAIALRPDDPNWLVASVLIDGVYQVHYSENAGESWTSLNEGLVGASILALLITELGNQRHVLAGAVDRGVFRLREDGDSWMPYGLSDRDVFTLGRSGNVFYAGTDHGVWLHPRLLLWLPVIVREVSSTHTR